MACPDCFRGGKAVGDPTGETTTLYGLSTYVASPPSTSTSQSTIILFTDAFGLKLVNNKLIADAYAVATGFRVLVPDIIPGGPMSPDVMPIMDKVMEPVSTFDILGQAARVFHTLRALSYFGPFFWRAFPSSPACTTPCLDYARNVKADLPPGAKLGAAGFCWGGYQSLNVCAEPAVAGGTERLIDAQFTAHPSGLKLPDDLVKAVTTFKTPVAVAQAENDFATKTKLVEDSEALIRQKVGPGNGEDGYYYEVKIYKGVAHGFAVRAKPGDAKEADGADEAKAQAIEWFKRFL
ncbi:hypothetical protein P154DRAFT_525750 [Amniculicola lignicola CBS 123094]|uniref:Dienelactone hydrolase domain-containing protein n=1 Tax=Amniculicola lignicola CBS 123094 TaxID=1392246 RepID=A0A6A5W531_9PLEO|nr:hypothetical protein P154DRAFT_525750 [Amniculicola lignicola CBS 123094]